MTNWTISRLSREWVGPITCLVNGTPTLNFELAVTLSGNLPMTETEWSAPTVINSAAGVLVGPATAHPLTPGTYQLWGRYTTATEQPVEVVGSVHVN